MVIAENDGRSSTCRGVVRPSLFFRQGVHCAGCSGAEPLTRIALWEAVDIARNFGARLPTALEWEWAAAGREERVYPWGNQPWNPRLAILRQSGVGSPLPVGELPEGATPDGLLDMAGNVWEWTSTEVPLGGAIIKGGSYNSSSLHAKSKFLNAAPEELRSGGLACAW
jgi:iron(II)-dependent oxidoreductase